jgi:hypothetical protein
VRHHNVRACVACLSVALTYFQLAIEDYRWWWRSFLCGAASGLFVYGYACFYFVYRSEMNGVLQASFFFGYMLMVRLSASSTLPLRCKYGKLRVNADGAYRCGVCGADIIRLFADARCRQLLDGAEVRQAHLPHHPHRLKLASVCFNFVGQQQQLAGSQAQLSRSCFGIYF